MRRRAWLGLMLASGMAASLGIARAQKPVRIGFIGYTSRSITPHTFEAFLDAMRDLGYVEGRNLVVEWRNAEGDANRFPGLAAELASMKLDLIVASVTPAAVAAKRASSTIPIVVCISADPVAAGLVASLSRPGGNVTGTSAAVGDHVPKQVELVRRLFPTEPTLALLTNPANPSHKSIARAADMAAKAGGFTVRLVAARSLEELRAAYAGLERQRVKTMIVAPDGLFVGQRRQLADLELKHGIAAIHHTRDHADAGSFVSYGVDIRQNYRLAATYVHRILRGAKPADLPVEQVNKLELVVNARTAKALGVDVPRDVLLLADRVIE